MARYFPSRLNLVHNTVALNVKVLATHRLKLCLISGLYSTDQSEGLALNSGALGLDRNAGCDAESLGPDTVAVGVERWLPRCPVDCHLRWSADWW
jgi:hypothetical protein